jgi:hypothetical protein
MDLVKKQASLPEVSLVDKLKAARNTKDKVILIDLSGSMSSYVADGTKYDIVKDILSEISATCYYFNSRCHKVDVSYLPYPSGSTDMAGAFVYLKARGISKFVMLTDGLPDDSAAALAEAKGARNFNNLYRA